MSDRQSANTQALIQQIMQATNSLSDEEAAQRYQQILAQLPPDQATELNALALSQVSKTQRRSLAGQFRQAHNSADTPFDGYDFNNDDEAASPMGLGRMSVRAQRQDPALLGSIFGEDSPLRGALGKAALSALAALLIRKLMENQQQGSSGQGVPIGNTGQADPLSSILGALLGGASGSSGQGVPIGNTGQADPLSSILDALLGGASGGGAGGGQQAPGGTDIGSILKGAGGGQQTPQGTGASRQTPQGDDLGSVLKGTGSSQQAPGEGQQAPGGIDIGAILGGLLGSGAVANQAPQGGGLGSLLDSILGGTTDNPASNPASRSHRR